MQRKEFIGEIIKLGKQILPEGASLWLYGSRARGEARENSDWDLLILLNKDKNEFADFGNYAYPFTMMASDRGEYIIPQIYTRRQWNEMHFTPFVKNVEQDKIILV